MSTMVSNKSELLQKLFYNRQKIKSFGVKQLSLFGSFLDKKQNSKSDIDFLVVFEQGQKNFDNFMELSFYLEDILGRRVEVITPESLSKYIGPHILKTAENVGL